MANILIRTEERENRQNEILRKCGYSPNNVNSSQKEMADYIAQKTYEEIKKMSK